MSDTATTAVRTDKSEKLWGTGRRKSAVAQVCLSTGEGKFLVNGRPVEGYFAEEKDRHSALLPLKASNLMGKYNVMARVKGGGPTGQAGAVQMGLARALIVLNAELKKGLQAVQATTRDSRMKERKKYGQRGARRRFQFSKR